MFGMSALVISRKDCNGFLDLIFGFNAISEILCIT